MHALALVLNAFKANWFSAALAGTTFTKTAAALEVNSSNCLAVFTGSSGTKFLKDSFPIQRRDSPKVSGEEPTSPHLMTMAPLIGVCHQSLGGRCGLGEVGLYTVYTDM